MRILVSIIIIFIANILFGQPPIKMGQSPAVDFSCSRLFQDSGGDDQPYAANESGMIVICADGTKGTHTKLTFSNADIATGDELCFFDGNDINAPMLSCSSDYFPGSPFVIQATAANNTGCLTITFNSNSSEQGKGWNAVIDCIPACQLIQVELEKTTPPANDTGYIDVCINERVFFDGKVIFPQNNLVYEHSATTSTFEWDFGDGTTGKGPSVSHPYKESGGYRVELIVTDQFGCQSSNFISQRVRVSTKPVFTIKDNFPDEVCEGDTICLNGGVENENQDANITVAATEGLFLTKGFRSDSLALPDGNGRSYETSISFADYRPGDVLTKVDDLFSICLNMEHSWLHDMEIFITCPNGRKAKLQEQVLINDEVFLGSPNDDDGINPEAGQGKEYCWSSAATFGTLTDFANRENDSGIGEPYYLPEGTFNSYETLSNLVGCPLNGEWTITVTDLWEQDNGWIFSWGIDFNPVLLPKPESYKPAIASFQWEDHSTIISKEPAVQPQAIKAVPSTPGMVSYTFETEDDYGCRNDTSIQIKVLPESDEKCLKCETNLFAYNEITLCEGDEVNLGSYIKPSSLGAVTFENQENANFGKSTGESTITSAIEVSGVTPNAIGSELEELVSVCVNLETNFTGDITLFLRAPSGNVITLSKENGGDSNNYAQTYFSPKATQQITNSAGPFTGIFAPEDDFSTFAGEAINGEWSLIASGNPGLIESYILKNWSLSFQGENNATFSWRPGINISSTIGINTTLKAEENTAPSYILTKEENGCITEDSLRINVIKGDIPIDVDYYNFEGGEVLFYWVSVPDANSYEISKDGLSWDPTDDEFFHREKGFQNGQSETFQFRAVFANQSCTTDPTPLVVNYLFCDLEASSLTSNTSVTCAGGTDAIIEVRASGGTPPYRYILNDSIEQDNGTFNDIPTGRYEVLVYDRDKICADTVSVLIGSPDSLGIDFTITPPSCSGESDASLTAFPYGGAGGYSNFSWKDLTTTDNTIDNLSAGRYEFSAVDAQGCMVTADTIIKSPPPLELIATQNPVSCFGDSDGSAGVKVKGGSPILLNNSPVYSYEWTDGQVTSDAVGLAIGTYSVTVSDGKGCSKVIETEVTQPPAIDISFKATPISCINEKDATIVAEAEGGIPPYKYKWENEQNSKLNFGLGVGTYFVTVIDAQGCEKVAAESITETTPVLAGALTTATKCAGTATGEIEVTVTGGATPYTYGWGDTLNHTTAIASDLPAGAYIITVTDANGCNTQVGATIIDALPIEIAPTGQEASCPNRSDGYSEIKVTGGKAPYEFLWDNGLDQALRPDLSPGNYAFTVTDKNNCIKTGTDSIGSPPALVIDTLLKILPRCNAQSNGSIEAVISGGTEPYKYEWDDGISQKKQNPIEGIAKGAYDLKITDSKGCELPVSNISLEEPSLLTVTTDKQDVFCFGEATGEVSAIPMGGTPPYMYRWSDGKNLNDSIATSLLENEYNVTVEDSNGCQETANATIGQPTSALTISVEQSKIGCAGIENSEATIIANGGTGTNYTYKWSDTNNTTAIANQLAAKTYFITVTDENNCEEQSSIVISELEEIDVGLISGEPSCFNATDGTLVVSSISGGMGSGNLEDYNFNWSNQGNTSQIDNLVGDSIYSLTVTDAQNCSSVVERYLSSPEEITLEYEVKHLACFEDDEGSISILNTSNQEAIDTYEWSTANSSNTPTIENLAAGDYQLIATTASGCAIIQNFKIDRPNALKVSNINTTPNNCFGDQKGSISFEVSGGSNNYAYLWSNNATTNTLENINQGSYQVVITDENDCVIDTSFTVEGPDTLIVNTVSQPTSCFGEEDGRFEINPVGGTPPYLYSLDGNRYQPSSTFFGLAAGTYTNYVQDANGCIGESPNEAINPGDVLLLDIISEKESLAIGDSTILTAAASSIEGDILLSWSANNSSSFECLDENCERILVKPQSSTKFEVYAIDAAGCEAEASLFLRLSNPKKVFVPTGFSPNNDGFNDVLLIHGQSNITVNYFRIYDRWGEEIFIASDFPINDSTIFWDGTYKGQPLNGGIFTWIMEVEYIDQQREIFKGNTTLLK